MTSSRLAIQLVHITWSKLSRGGDAARKRNAISLAFPLPLDSFAAPITCHRIGFIDPQFTPNSSIDRFDTMDEVPFRDLRLAQTETGISVFHLRDRFNAAIADRLFPDQFGNTVYEMDAFLVGENEWGQIQYNGRYVDVDTGNWWYEQSVYNIGLLRDVDLRRFVDTKPNHRFVELASLH